MRKRSARVRFAGSLCFLLATLSFFGTLATAGHLGSNQSVGDALGFSPHWDWRRIETEHFRVDYPAELAEVAQKAAHYFEQAHGVLSPMMQWKPRTRVQVVLIDNTDAANGLASPVLRFGMVLMTTPPESWFTIAYYDDWLKLLVFHEYTHFLNMDPTRKFWGPLRSIFGDVLLPNAIWPSWMLEGLAVYMETLHTQEGRGRSPYYEMLLRSAVDDGVFGSSEWVSLDRINGPNPYFPGGETPYFFGYQLMNRAAAAAAQARGQLSEGEVLGELSARSSGRVPFFINENARNVTGEDWYAHWESWVDETRQRMEAQLHRIRSQPETTPERLTKGAYQVLGSAISPDGRWLAFTMETYAKRMGLYLRDQETGKIRRLADKRLGAQMAFTPDSKRILFSSLETQSVYSQFSDLAYYDLEKKRVIRLSSGLRARDPDVSSDGKFVVFSLSQNAVTGLARARLFESAGMLSLGKPEVLFMPALLDRVSNPRFSPDGSTVFFSLHRNGVPGTEIVAMHVKSGSIWTLVSDGNFNRFPAISPDGELYFISDATGVDNLYRYNEVGAHELFTNVATGIYFPVFGRESDNVHASVFSSRGSDLARIRLAENPLDRVAVTLDPPPAPMRVEGDTASPEEASYPVTDYSVFPSIWPRQWLPVLYLEPRDVYLGAQVLGFDAVDRHRYVLGVGYSSLVNKPDWFSIYTNRSLGPSVTLTAEQRTSAASVRDPFVLYSRKSRVSVAASFPFRKTYSTLVPAVALELERSKEFVRDTGGTFDELVYKSRYVPQLDLRLGYSNTEQSRLAVVPEGGRQAFMGARVYFDESEPVWKGLLMDREFIPLAGRLVWSPSLNFSVSSRTSDFLGANVLVRGRSFRLMSPLPNNNFDHLGIRGYPGRLYFARAAGVLGQDISFPVADIFRGWGTNPLFLQQMAGFVFAESAFFPSQTLGRVGVRSLPSAGAGLKLDSQVFVHVPLSATLEYHHGFRRAAGGRSEVVTTLAVGAFF